VSLFLERVLYRIVDVALQQITARPLLYERWLLKNGLSTDEAKNARQAFETAPLRLMHGYAHDGAYFPCASLILGSETVAQDFLNEDAPPLDEDGEPYIDEDGNVVDPHARRWEYHWEWYIYVGHHDLCLYYYYLIRHLCVAARAVFQAAGIDEIVYGGAELAPDPRYLPADMWVRRFSVTARAMEEYTEAFGEGQFKTIEGMIVDAGEKIAAALSSEEAAEVEAVAKNITVGAPDEGDE
jgi:hypothetical protein